MNNDLIKTEVRVVMAEFLKACRVGDIRTMLEHSQLTWRSVMADTTQELTDLAKALSITEFEVIRVDIISNVLVRCVVKRGINQGEVTLVKESAPYTPDEKGKWGVNPISAFRLVKRSEQLDDIELQKGV